MTDDALFGAMVCSILATPKTEATPAGHQLSWSLEMTRSTLTFAMLALAGLSHAQDLPTGFLNRSLQFEGRTYPYQVYVPRDYDPARKWPIILFLHGAGERGDNGSAQTQEGLGTPLRLWPERWPAIAVFPQAPHGTNWHADQGRMAMATLAAAEAEFNIDLDRTYLTGISMGGNGTWYLGYQHPERWAAMCAICGFLEHDPTRYQLFTPPTVEDPFAEVAAKIKDIPVWIVHGEADPVVSVEQSRHMNAALKNAGAEVHYVEVPGEGHGSWHPGYASEELAAWLFSKKHSR